MATKKPDPATEVAEVVDASVVPVDDGGDAGISEWLAAERPEGTVDAVSTYREIVGQVLDSQSVFDVLMPPETRDCKSSWGRPFLLTKVRFNESTFDNGSPIYASMDVIWPDTGVHEVINSGVQRMIAQLLKLHQFNQFPQMVVIERSETLNRFGNYMYWLTFAPGGYEAAVKLAAELGPQQPPPVVKTDAV